MPMTHLDFCNHQNEHVCTNMYFALGSMNENKIQACIILTMYRPFLFLIYYLDLCKKAFI